MMKKIIPQIIALEGVDGIGKTTQLEYIEQILTEHSIDYALGRQPGGTEYAETVRKFLKFNKESPIVKTHGMISSMLSFLVEHIQPAVTAEKWVVIDRWLMSTLLYQGIMEGVKLDYILGNYRAACGNFNPDYYLVFNADPATINTRAKTRGDAPDALEPTGEQQLRVGLAYQSASCFTPVNRAIISINATGTKEEVGVEVTKVMEYIIKASTVDDDQGEAQPTAE